jgi:hypothetical protein
VKTAEEYRILYNAAGVKLLAASKLINAVYKVCEEESFSDPYTGERTVHTLDIYKALGDDNE